MILIQVILRFIMVDIYWLDYGKFSKKSQLKDDFVQNRILSYKKTKYDI